MKDHREFSSATTCPHCGAAHEVATSTTQFEDATAPRHGDLSLCIQCGQWAVFTHDGALRTPSPDEATHIKRAPFCQQAEFSWFLMDLHRRQRSAQ
jgi:hypothetical protein